MATNGPLLRCMQEYGGNAAFYPPPQKIIFSNKNSCGDHSLDNLFFMTLCLFLTIGILGGCQHLEIFTAPL